MVIVDLTILSGCIILDVARNYDKVIAMLNYINQIRRQAGRTCG